MVKKTAKYVMWILMLLQIAAGAIWLVGNLLCVPLRYETTEYLTAARTFVLDEYIGILYPLLLRILLLVETVCGLPYQLILYGMQLAAAVTALHFFLKEIGFKKGKKWLVLLYLLTIPMILQYHLTVLPASFLFSISILLVAMTVRMWKKQEILLKELLTVCGLWLVAALLEPDYLILFAVYLVIYFVVFFIKRHNKKRLLQTMAGILGTILLTTGVNAITQTPGSLGKIQRSVEATMFQRLVGQHFATTYYFWSHEVRVRIPQEEALNIAKRNDGLAREVGPFLDKELGREAANKEYASMALKCLQVRTREVVEQIGRDYTDYQFMPFSFFSQGREGHVSAAGFNYSLFKQQYPLFSKWYFQGSICGVIIGCVLTLTLTVLQRIRHKKSYFCGGWFALLMILQAVFYTLSSSNPVDYGKALFVICGWYLLGSLGTVITQEEKKVEDKLE